MAGCYGCLRNRRNEHHHERLSRGAALDALRALAGLGADLDAGADPDAGSGSRE
jgi:hypothetical protein